MSFVLQNITQNQVTLTNQDNLAPISYTFYVMDTDQFFSPLTGYPSDPTLTLAASGSVTIDLVNDGVYRLDIAGTPNASYFFIMEYNLKTCEKTFLQAILCNPCGDSSDCAKSEYIQNVYSLIRFNTIKNNLYYIYNRYVQTQSITDLIVPPNGELATLSSLISMLNSICNTCGTTSGCQVCNSNTVSTFSSSGCNCGC